MLGRIGLIVPVAVSEPEAPASSLVLQQLQSTEAELKKTKNQLRSMELRAQGYELSPDLSQGVFVISDDGVETLEGGEQELADRILDPKRDYNLLDITESLITFMAQMKQSGNAPAIWPETMGRLTLSSNFVKDSQGNTIRPTAEEKVFLKIGPRQFFFERTSPEAREDRDYLEKRILRNSGVDYATINKLFLERKALGDIRPLTDESPEEASLAESKDEVQELILPSAERLSELVNSAPPRYRRIGADGSVSWFETPQDREERNGRIVETLKGAGISYPLPMTDDDKEDSEK